MIERENEIKLSPTLVDMIGQGRCILVAGPLISLVPPGRLGPPNPAWMAFELADRIGKQLDNYDLPRVAQRYAEDESPHALRVWVRDRLSDPRYRPTLAHHLIAQLPFKRIVYTAQDLLLKKVFDSRNLSVTFVQPGGSLNYTTDRSVILLFGSIMNPEILKLTEDERRHVFRENSSLAEEIHRLAEQNCLLVLGYALNDPALSDLYYELRPKRTEEIKNFPRAYLVGPGLSLDYEKYWNQHNATSYGLDASTFLQELARNLDEKKYLHDPIDFLFEESPSLSQEEIERRNQLTSRFESQSGINEWVETGEELRRRFEPHFIIQMNMGMEKRILQSEAESSSSQERDKASGLNLLQSGNVELSQGNLELASAYFEKAIRLDPKLTDAHLSLYHLLIEKNDLDGAFQAYQDLIHEMPIQAFLPPRYQIRKILERIDLGVSYCVYDQEDDQLVTVTILRRTFALQEETLAQFVRHMSALSSSRISHVLGYDRHRGRTYIISSYMDGQTLRERLRNGKPLDYGEAMEIAGQIADALEAGQNQATPHLDLQPENIVLADGPKLVNYGFSRLARLAWGSSRAVKTNSSNYLSPEQLAGNDGDARSDIYALGTILYEMLTGYPPGFGKLEHASEINIQVTEAVDVLIDHARERYPDQRFISPGGMSAEINRITLSSLNKQPNQYLRVGLAWISQQYDNLTSRKFGPFVLSMMVAFLVLSVISSTPEILNAVARLLFLFLLSSFLTSFLFDWSVRAVARRKGLGSLIKSGRGMGVILGLIFTLNLIFLAGIQDFFQTTEILNALVAMSAVIFFEAVLGLAVILGAARAIERFFKSYTSGFYWSFVAIVIIELVLTIFRQPHGLFTI